MTGEGVPKKGKRRMFISYTMVDDEFVSVPRELEESKFETHHLPAALDLGGDWNDATELRDSMIELHIDEMSDAIQRLEMADELTPDQEIEVNGVCYQIDHLPFGASIVYRQPSQEEKAGFFQKVGDSNEEALDVFVVVMVVPTADIVTEFGESA